MLPRENRITKKKEIDEFFGLKFKQQNSCFASDKYFLVKKIKTNKPFVRFGFVVNLKYDKSAPKRNKIKRQLRQIVLLHLTKMKKGANYLVIVFAPAKDLDYAQIKIQFLQLLKKLNAF